MDCQFWDEDAYCCSCGNMCSCEDVGAPQGAPYGPSRDISAAANRLMRADNAELEMIVQRDPGMIRDVAAALYSKSFTVTRGTT